MKFSLRTRLLIALGSGLAEALAFPSFDLPIFAWIALAGLMLAVLGAPPRTAFLLGWLQGAGFYFLSVPWFYTVMRQYGPLSVPEAGGVLVVMVVASALFHAVFALALAWVGRRDTAQACVAAPFLWVGAEFAITHLPHIGFPWNLLGYAPAQNLALVQLAAVTGIFGLSLLVAAYNALLAWAILRPAAGRTRAFGVCAVVTLALAGIAWVAPRWVPVAAPDRVAHLVQTNFPQSLSYPHDWMQKHSGELDQLESLSVDAAQRLPGLIVWPEVPAPFSLQDAELRARVERIARVAGHGFLFGVVAWRPQPGGGLGATNSAALLDRDGAVSFVYDKVHLVPFGEYVPWRSWLTFAGKLTADIGDFERGSEYTVGRLPSGGIAGVFICFEAVFPGEVRRFTAAGADVLVNLSNDGWFGRSAAPAQHLAMARVRAVENRRWLLRDTNNGITVSVDPYGRIVARLPADVRGQLDAPYALRSDTTFYARWGDWIAWLCVIAAAMLLLLGARAPRARRTHRRAGHHT